MWLTGSTLNAPTTCFWLSHETGPPKCCSTPALSRSKWFVATQTNDVEVLPGYPGPRVPRKCASVTASSSVFEFERQKKRHGESGI
eukprot:794495-Rhodomonas_salina.1